jgi:hypothetical protein
MDERLLRAQARADWRQQQDLPGADGMPSCAAPRQGMVGDEKHMLQLECHMCQQPRSTAATGAAMHAVLNPPCVCSCSKHPAPEHWTHGLVDIVRS